MEKDIANKTQQQPAPYEPTDESTTASALSRREFLKVSAGVLVITAWGGIAISSSEASTGPATSTSHPFLPDPLDTRVLGMSTFVAGSRGALRIGAKPISTAR